MSLKLRYTLCLTVLMALAFTLLFTVMSLSTFELTKTQESDFALLAKSVVENQMQSQLDAAEMSVLSISNNTEVQRLFARLHSILKVTYARKVWR